MEEEEKEEYMEVIWNTPQPLEPLEGLETVRINGEEKHYPTRYHSLTALADFEDWSLEVSFLKFFIVHFGF